MVTPIFAVMAGVFHHPRFYSFPDAVSSRSTARRASTRPVITTMCMAMKPGRAAAGLRRKRSRIRTAHTPAGPPHESPLGGPPCPLILLGDFPFGLTTGWLYIEPMLFGGLFRQPPIVVRASRNASCWAELKEEWHGVCPVHAAWASPSAAVLACRCRDRDPARLLLSDQSGAAAARLAEDGRAWLYTLLDKQVLLRQVQRLVLRRPARARRRVGGPRVGSVG